ncbi:hypothetical protein Tco_0696665 [Tanacetum coccineum]
MEEDTNFNSTNSETKDNSSDLSRPPGFEFMKKSFSSSSNCSTSFARRRKNDIKGFSLLSELNQIIDVGSSLGYDHLRLEFSIKVAKANEILYLLPFPIIIEDAVIITTDWNAKVNRKYHSCSPCFLSSLQVVAHRFFLGILSIMDHPWHASKREKTQFYVITTSVLWWAFGDTEIASVDLSTVRKSDLFDNVRIPLHFCGFTIGPNEVILE